MGTALQPSGLRLVASTGSAGFALQNGTPNILSWAAPNDGAMHRAIIPAVLSVTSAETGGIINVVFTTPDSGPQNKGFIGGGQGIGYTTSGNNQWFMALMAPGTTLVVEQFSALTAGAATLWAEIWAS